MSISQTNFHGMPAWTVTAPDGARAVVTRHGGHVVSWRVAGSEQEQLYLSPASQYAAGKPIRGGVPVVFPQFSDRGTGMRHGFARTLDWQPVPDEALADEDISARLLLRLVDDDATRAMWPHAFRLELSVRVQGNTLAMHLSCMNTGSAPWDFGAALHTYLAVQDVALARLHGLAGADCEDCVAGERRQQDAQPLQILGEVDRVYSGVGHGLQLDDPAADGGRTLAIAQQGFADVVVWNPGPERCAALSDMPADGYRHMLCVEAAQASRPLTLAPGASWSGMQTLSVLP